MKVEVVSRVSKDFKIAIGDAISSFPDYFSQLNTAIALGPRLKSIFNDVDGEHRSLVMLYRGKTDTIGIAEYGRGYQSGRLFRNFSTNNHILESIAHETGHAFDRYIFGDGTRQGYFSVQEDKPFYRAWVKDLEKLNDNPDLYSKLSAQFSRFLEIDDCYGARETFAEIWTNSHGYSAMKSLGIDDIRLFWPRCTEIVEDCIASLS